MDSAVSVRYFARTYRLLPQGSFAPDKEVHICSLTRKPDTEMKTFFVLTLILGLAVPAGAQDTYKKPFPHSSGAQLLSYCQETDEVISQLRCNYYVQGVADLAVQVPLACIPRGMNQTELMQLAIDHLASTKQDVLEKSSAASLILTEFQKQFRCPKKEKTAAAASNPYTEAIRKAMHQKALDNANKEK
jgi:hypothetical protein